MSIIIIIIIITYPCSTCGIYTSFFAAAASLLFCSFLKCFFVLVYDIFVQCSKRTYVRTLFKEHSRSFKNRDHANMAI